MTEPDVYRVGLFNDLATARGAFRRRDWRRAWWALKRVAAPANRRRSYLNGWLAEDPDASRNCGHGWTRRRALASLEGQDRVADL